MQGIDFTGHEKAETTLRLAKAGSHNYTPGVFNQRGDSVSGDQGLSPPGRKEPGVLSLARPWRDTA